MPSTPPAALDPSPAAADLAAEDSDAEAPQRVFPELASGLVVAERFRLVRALGQGGMGAVWVAQHTELDTPCALKFIHEEGAREPEVIARFKREAKAAARLRSSHVVQILDHGVWRGMPYIAMELLEGEDLSKRLRRLRRLPPDEVFRVVVQVGRAIAKAHAAGLVHRDLKPANIFIVKEDDREIVKVLDFGVVKATRGSALAESDTKTGNMIGTPHYMSPEQLAGRDVDQRADLWALAVVVYRCLTGKLPFRAEFITELIVSIMTEPLPVPSRAAPDAGLPPAFDAWWARAACPDATKRFQTTKEFVGALAMALDRSLTSEALGAISDPGGRASLAGEPAPRSADTPLSEASDSGTQHTASPTVTPQTLPAGLRQRSPLRVLAAAAILLGGVAAFLALRGRAATTAGEAPAEAAPSIAPASTPATPTSGDVPAIIVMPATAEGAASAPPRGGARASSPPAAKPAPRPGTSASAPPSTSALPVTAKPKTDWGI